MLLKLFAVFSFLLNLRSKQLNVSQYIKDNYGEGLQRVLWRYCSTSFRITKAQLDINFLTSCKTYGIIPKFLRFKLYKRSLHTTSIYRSLQFKLLDGEINSRRSSIAKLQPELKELKSNLQSNLSFFTFILVQKILSSIER